MGVDPTRVDPIAPPGIVHMQVMLPRPGIH